jgi:class 3 adenylate cyclase
MKARDVVVAAAAAVIASGLVALPAFDRLEGMALDSLFWLRHQAFGARHAPETSPTVVIAIDEETYRRAPFRDSPKVMWTKELAQILTATLDAGARVVGFDVIFPTSVEGHIKGFDRDLLVALAKAKRQGRVVLGKIQHQLKPIKPFAGYGFAVGGARNIRAVNAFADVDGVIRRIPLTFKARTLGGETRAEPSMALELASRALGEAPRMAADGAMVLGGYAIPGSKANQMTINFGTTIPAYSFADIHACARGDRKAYFKQHFAGKVVLIGVVLDVEDRKLTSARYITRPEGASAAERCELPLMKGILLEGLIRDTIPGVFVHATAVNNLLRKEAVRELDRAAYALITLVLALVVAAGTMWLSPMRAALALAAGALIWAAAATFAFKDGLVLPLLDPLAAGGLTFGALLGYRFSVSDKDKRYLRKMFSYYLSPAVVEQLVADPSRLKLGGERRELTIIFTDITGFTSLTESTDPTVLVPILNSYLDRMCRVILKHGGTIDKIIGDAFLALFNAPADQPDHATRAVDCALALDQCARAFVAEQAAEGIDFGATRIGVHTGMAVVGNFGGEARFDYTAHGDAINIAARLEGANKHLGTLICISGATAGQCGDRDFRPVGGLVLKGKTESVEVFEPIPEEAVGSPKIAEYSRAFELLKSGSTEARAAFSALAEEYPDDGLIRFHARRLIAGEAGSLIVMEEK